MNVWNMMCVQDCPCSSVWKGSLLETTKMSSREPGNKRWCNHEVGLPSWLSGKRIRLSIQESKEMRWERDDPWVRKGLERKKWQPISVFLPRESHGQRRLVGYSPWSLKELDMTEATHHVHVQLIYSALLVSCIQYSDLKAFYFFNSLYFIICYYKILGIVLCAVQ